MTILKLLPIACPSCSGQLMVKTMHCPSCSTIIDGSFDIPALSKIDMKDQQFILSFVKHSGSLKQMAKELGLSYPTVRNRLDDVIAKLVAMETPSGENT